uniref:Uncharacterized protein n=1 Tax=Candidozyma auris TaxID=498019 RepID=A0A0L0P8N4_CANAR
MQYDVFQDTLSKSQTFKTTPDLETWKLNKNLEDFTREVLVAQ